MSERTTAGRYEGKVALVTGGASGLGEATARLLVAEGGNVVIADYGAERGQAVADSLGDHAVFVRCESGLGDECTDLLVACIVGEVLKLLVVHRQLGTQVGERLGHDA